MKCAECKGEGVVERYLSDGLHAGQDVPVECGHCDATGECPEDCYCDEDAAPQVIDLMEALREALDPKKVSK